MKTFKIVKPDQGLRPALKDKIDNLTKPLRSLGLLEDLALQIGLVQQTLTPKLTHPCHIVFAGDHGITAEKVSPSPQEVTRQMIVNFLQGGAGVNFLARQHGFDLQVVDAGVNYDFPSHVPVIDKKIRMSTRNYLYEAAMTEDEMLQALDSGADCVQECFDKGCNIISFGEMGISNTSSSSLWMTYLTGIPLEKCIGAGCDSTGTIIAHKCDVLRRAMANYKGDSSIEKIMQQFGGYEMVMTVGGMLKAAELKMLVLVDGFIMTNCVLAASKISPEVLDYCIYGHCGDEAGHQLVLDYLHAQPILHLGFRLGEGTGAICAFPIVDSAVRMINEMQSFRTFDVTKYF